MEDRATQGRNDLTRSERNVVALAEQDPLRFATSTAVAIADMAGTSEATVTRTAHKLGFSGVKEFKQACASQVGAGRSLGATIRDRLKSLEGHGEEVSSHGTARAVLAASAQVLLEFSESFPKAEFEETVGLVESSRRTVVYGLGTGSHVAEYLSLGLRRIGLRSRAASGSGHTLADEVHSLESEDAVIVVAPRVLFNDIDNLIAEAAPRVARVVLVSQAPPSPRSPEVLYLPLPSTAGSPASEITAACALSDSLVSEIARRHPATAIRARDGLQRLRDALSPARTT
ncbi:MurR/RpiR family transcriptional regulator [Nocardiopsis eucommiae]|uniref:MurR/RpiR family transcriptional regulator n=1 Tax=Nocardiopsis eucommiae TaxID=2831970 RepID=UPI003D73B2F2